MTSSATGEDLVVTLNVGGSQYTTNASTLTKFAESRLANITNSQLHRTKDTAAAADAINHDVFIDRDGPTFRHVLNFLRTGKLSLPSEFSGFDLLENEAEFYEIEPLVDAVLEARAAAAAAARRNRSTGVDAIGPGSEYLELYECCVDESVFVIARKKTIDSLPLQGKSSHFNLPVYMGNIGLFGNSYQFAGFGIKLKLFDHLLTSGWTMASTSFSCFADRKDALPKAVNRYVWYRQEAVAPPTRSTTSSGPTPTAAENAVNGSTLKSNGPAIEAEV